MKLKIVAAIAALALATAACQNSGMGTKQTVGTLGGAAAGGLLGAQFGSGTGALVATGLGVLLGAYAGNEIGRQMDENDRLRAQQAYDQAATAPVGQTITWNNPNSGNYGTVTPTRDGNHQDGRYCREYQTTVVVGGKTEQAHGTACQNPDGTWEII